MALMTSHIKAMKLNKNLSMKVRRYFEYYYSQK